MLRSWEQFVESNFSGAVVVDEHSTMVNFEIPAASVGKLSRAFSILEQEKDSLGVSDYAMSQSTLEQVIISYQ